MVQSGNIAWDVILTDIPAVLTLTKDNLLEPLDYATLDRQRLDKIPKELQRPYALGQRIYSFNIVYNIHLLPKSKHPRNWADVWDAKQFPGGRTFNFQGGIEPQLEVALLADGVPVDKLYPLDVERAWKMFDKLRPLVSKWYTSHARRSSSSARAMPASAAPSARAGSLPSTVARRSTWSTTRASLPPTTGA